MKIKKTPYSLRKLHLLDFITKMSKATAARISLPSNHTQHTHHHPVHDTAHSHLHLHEHHHDRHSDLHCHTCAEDLKLKKSSSESSETTVIEPTWVPPVSVNQHPPPREMTESELDAYSPFWVPNPESPAERDTRPRTLVLCFDGTGDQFDDDVSEKPVF